MPDTPVFNPATVIPIATPAYQVTGGQFYKLNFETTAEQVRTSDGLNVETRLTTLERAVAGTRVAHTVQTIADRDALTSVHPGDRAYVIDATGDDTVTTGAAVYLFMSDGSWLKLAEEESLEAQSRWENIEGKPDSTPANIDLAVAKQHVHDNTETLAHLAHDDLGLTFKGEHVVKKWIARGDSLADVPADLADGGLFFVNASA